MMRIILLLLVALTGPLCTFTRASTLVVPTDSYQNVTKAIEAPQTAVTEKAEEQATLSTKAPDSVATEVTTAYAQSTEVQSEGPEEEAHSTNSPTEAGAEELITSRAPVAVDKAEEENTTVKVEEEEATGTGQLVGIVIGALIAVIVVIAVIILVVRRMGQYSP